MAHLKVCQRPTAGSQGWNLGIGVQRCGPRILAGFRFYGLGFRVRVPGPKFSPRGVVYSDSDLASRVFEACQKAS